MFWKKKPKLPITLEDKLWVDEGLNALKNDLGIPLYMSLKTITPTKNYFNRTFDGSEQDAIFLLERTKELMQIKKNNIILEFYSDQPIEMADGTILSTPADIYGKWEGAAGTFRNDNKNSIIAIEKGQLKNTLSLIATIAHELAHEKLLIEYHLEINDEYFTDLTTVFYGFGLFLGNSKFNFKTYRTVSESGWEMSSQGYLPEQLIAYAMAKIAFERNENTDYKQFMNSTLKKYFEQSFNFLDANKKNIDQPNVE